LRAVIFHRVFLVISSVHKGRSPGPAQTGLPKTPSQDNQRRHMPAPQAAKTEFSRTRKT
jgi:hypothetical protein